MLLYLFYYNYVRQQEIVIFIITMSNIFVVLFTEKKNLECKAPYGGT